MTAAWKSVLEALQPAVSQIVAHQADVIPQIIYPREGSYGSNGLGEHCTPEVMQSILYRGAAIIKGVVPEAEALSWKARFLEYAAANPTMRGFPADDKQVFESYWSKAQVEARGHLAVLDVSRAFLKLFNAPHQLRSTGDDADTDLAISLANPVTYCDRLRIRHPGDSRFALGPHIDGGGVERWEDRPFRSFWKRILEGKCSWREHDPWSLGDNGERLAASGDLYGGPGQVRHALPVAACPHIPLK